MMNGINEMTKCICIGVSRKMFVEMCEYISNKAQDDMRTIDSSYATENEKKEAKKNLEAAKLFLKVLYGGEE